MIDKNRKSGASNESDNEISGKDFPWFDAIHNVMKDKTWRTNPPHVTDSTNTQQIDVLCRESEKYELLSFMPHKNPSIKEVIGGDGFEEERLKHLWKRVLGDRLHQVYNQAFMSRLQLHTE